MNFFLNKKLIYFLFFLFFSFLKTNYALSNDKIYLDLLTVKFDNKINYKKYQISTQLLTKTDLDKEIQNWIKQNIVLKGNSGNLIVQILDESVIDSFVEEHKEKFSFLPKDGSLIFSIFFIALIALIICPLSISPWAAFGSAIRNLVKNNKLKALIEYLLAFLLLITAILIVIQK